MDAFFPATVLDDVPLAHDQHLITLRVDDAVAQSHVRPGQYCLVRAQSGVLAPFAMYSAPRETFAFITRDAGSARDTLLARTPLETSLVRGAGFDLDAERGRELVLVATGTGFAPLRATASTIVTRRADFAAVTFYYGVRDLSWVAVPSELERFRAHGIDVRVVESRGPFAGYVQHALETYGSLANASVLAVGHTEMLDALRPVVSRLGLPATKLLLNY